MSSGSFANVGYEMNAGTIAPIRVQPETLLFTSGGVANDAPAGSTNFPVSAKISKTSRETGLKPRGVTFEWDLGQVPVDYVGTGTVFIPVLQQSVFNGYTKNAAATYLGGTGRIVNLFNEQTR